VSSEPSSGARHAAWRILRSGSTTPLREVDRLAAAYGLDDRDRGLLRRLVGTEVRRRATLRAIVLHYTRGKPPADVAAHLRLGLTQLLFMDRVPAHAAVSETVRACSDTLGLPRGRLVNSVLRTLQRALRSGLSGDPRRDIIGREWHFEQPVFRDPAQHPLLWAEDALSIPSALLKRWRKRLGDEVADGLARLALDEAPLSMVALKGERDALGVELASIGIETTDGGHPRVLLAPTSAVGALIASEAFGEGRVTIQGQSAWSAAELLDPQPEERLLDLCAAPGGKTAALARSGARVLALDINPTRMAPIAAGLARVGASAQMAACDGTQGLAPDTTFAGVLVDAPCSNTGVLAARPGARWRFGPGMLRELGQLQARLLDEAAARVTPGGRLVYSVCSIEPEEGPRRMREFLAANDGWTLAQELEALPAPIEVGGPVDGGYAARLDRV
jgi:16S rRNA (cytosine967-C5)-methyltransferase